MKSQFSVKKISIDSYCGIVFVDTLEPEIIKQGYRLYPVEVKFSIGTKEYPLKKPTLHYGLPFALNIDLPFDNAKYYPKLRMAKDMEGFNLHIKYHFCKQPEYGYEPKDCIETTKTVDFKLPENENNVTAEEKDLLKALFIGGNYTYPLRLEAKGGGKAEMKFIKCKN